MEFSYYETDVGTYIIDIPPGTYRFAGEQKVFHRKVKSRLEVPRVDIEVGHSTTVKAGYRKFNEDELISVNEYDKLTPEEQSDYVCVYRGFTEFTPIIWEEKESIKFETGSIYLKPAFLLASPYERLSGKNWGEHGYDLQPSLYKYQRQEFIYDTMLETFKKMGITYSEKIRETTISTWSYSYDISYTDGIHNKAKEIVAFGASRPLLYRTDYNKILVPIVGTLEECRAVMNQDKKNITDIIRSRYFIAQKTTLTPNQIKYVFDELENMHTIVSKIESKVKTQDYYVSLISCISTLRKKLAGYAIENNEEQEEDE